MSGLDIQFRHETGLTAAEYVTRRGWKEACPSPPACLRGRARGCRLQGHGTYGRKRPAGMRIRRWYCAGCGITFSALPDCAASRVSGTLEEIDAVVTCASSSGMMAAVRLFLPFHMDPVSSWRYVRRRCRWVAEVLSILRGLSPLFFGMEPTLPGLRAHLGPGVGLRDLRGLCAMDLPYLPHPVGFRPPSARSGKPRGPPTGTGHGSGAWRG